MSSKKYKKKSIKKKSRKKKSILNYNEELSDFEIDIIKSNFLVNKKNINKYENEILLQSGIILKDVSNNIYTIFDPLAISTICLSKKIFIMLASCINHMVFNIYNKNEKLKLLVHKKFKRFLNYESNEKLPQDGLLLLKILKMIFNENIEPSFKKLNKKKNIKIIN